MGNDVYCIDMWLRIHGSKMSCSTSMAGRIALPTSRWWYMNMVSSNETGIHRWTEVLIDQQTDWIEGFRQSFASHPSRVTWAWAAPFVLLVRRHAYTRLLLSWWWNNTTSRRACEYRVPAKNYERNPSCQHCTNSSSNHNISHSRNTRSCRQRCCSRGR